MSYLAQATSEKPKRGIRMIIYGPPKIGKTTFGADVPNHIFMQLEKGLQYVEKAHALPYTESYDVVKEMITELGDVEKHKYRTLVVDTIDMLETRIADAIVKSQNNPQVKTLQDIAYGRGIPMLIAETHKVLSAFDWLRDKGINIILLAHDDIKKFEPPVGAPYTYHAPSLYSKTSTGDNTLKLYTDWADVIAYCDFKTIVKEVDAGFGAKKGQALGTGERVMFLDASNPSYVAGSRIPLPKEIRFSWADFAAAHKAAISTKTEEVKK